MLYYYNEGKSEKGEGEKKKEKRGKRINRLLLGYKRRGGGGREGSCCMQCCCFCLLPSFPNVSPAGSSPSLDASLAERRGMNVE